LTEAIALATFQDLLELNLFDNEIDDIQPLTSLILLEVLDLSGNRIVGIMPLRSIDLSGTNVTSIAVLLLFEELEYVNLSDTAIATSTGSTSSGVIAQLRDLGIEVEL